MLVKNDVDKLVKLAIDSKEYGGNGIRQWQNLVQNSISSGNIHTASYNGHVVSFVIWYFNYNKVCIDLLVVDKSYKGNKALLVRNMLKDALNNNRWKLKVKGVKKIYWKASRHGRIKEFSIRR